MMLRLCVGPQVAEAMAVCLLGMWIFNMPFILAFVMGWSIASNAPAMVIAAVRKLVEHKKGMKVGITNAVLAANVIDDPTSVILSTIGATIAMNAAPANTHKENIGKVTGEILYQLATGIAFGCLGFFGILLKRIKNPHRRKYIMAMWLLFFSIAFPIAAFFADFE